LVVQTSASAQAVLTFSLLEGKDMKPPDEKMPEELRNQILEQMPWLKNPNDRY
jgi:hypothetical protein